MKKILGLAVLGLLLGAAPVLAQGTVSVANVTAQPGATVDVPVYVSDLPQIGGASISIQMVAPTGAPALVAGEAVKGTVFPNANDVIQTDLAIPGQVQVVAVSPGVSKGPGTLFTVPITVPAAATAGTTYQLHVTRTEVVDAANNPLAITARDGSLTVSQAATPVVSVASASGAPGQTINLAVNVSEGAKGLGGGSVELYMPGLTVAGDAVNGNVFTGPNVVVSTDRTKPNQPVVVVVTSTSGNGPGTLFTIPVTIPANATPGQVFPVMLGAVDIIDTSNNTIPVGKQDGAVTVAAQITATVRVAPTSAAAGTTAMVSIQAGAGVQNLAAIRMTLDLGALAASGDATLAGGLFAGIANTQLSTDRSNPSQPKIILVSPGAVNGPGTLFTIPVPVPANATPGTLLPINITAVEALDSNNQPLPIVAETGGGILVLAAGQYIQVNPETVAPGQTFNLAVSIGPGVQGVAGVRATLNLGGLTAAGPATKDGTLFANVPNTIVQTDLTNPGRPGVILVSPGAVNGPGLLFTIPVTVPATAEDGDIFQVNLEGLEVIDQNNQPMPLPIAPGSGVITVRSVGAGVISVVSVTGVNPGDTFNLQIAANDRVIGLAGARFGLNLGGLTATGNATLSGGIFAGIANTQISTNLANAGAPEVILVSPGAANGPGTVFSIPVQVPASATVGQVFTIGLTVSDAIDANNQPLPVAAQGGTVTVGPGVGAGIVSVQNATGAPGATINLTIAADANVKDLGGVRFALDLGSMTATGDAVLTGGIFANVANTQIATDRTNPSKPQIIIVSAGSASGPGAVFTIPVQIPASAAPNSTIPVGLSVAEAINSQNQPIQLIAQGGVVTVQQAGPLGIVKVQDISGAAGSVINLAIAADANVKDLAGARFGLDLGGLSATGDATIAGGIFANVANTRIATDRTNAGKPQVILVSAGSANGPGTVFTIPVQIPASATAGQTFTVTLTVSDAINSQNQTIQLTAQPGTVTVSGVPAVGVVKVQDLTVAAGSTANLVITADENVKNLGGARVALDLGPLTATGDATLTGGIFANVANTQIATDRTDPSKPQVILVSAGAASGPGTLFSLPISVPLDQAGKTITVNITSSEFIDAQNQTMNLTVAPGTVTVTGAPPANIVLSVGSTEGPAGGTVQLPISLNDQAKNIGGVRVTLNVGALTPGQATKGELLAAEDQIGTNITPGQADVIVVIAHAANGPGVLFNLPLTIPANATDGQVFPVTVTHLEMIDTAGNPLAATSTPGQVVARAPLVNVISLSVANVAPNTASPVRVRVDGAQSMAGIDLTVTYDGRLGKFDTTTVAAAGIAGADTQIRADDTAGTGNNRTLRIIMVSPHTFPEGQSGTIATINFVGAGPDSLHPLDSSLLMPTAVTMVDANNTESDITAKARPGGLIAGAWVFNARFDLPNAGNISSSVSIVGNQVYFGDTLGRLYALDATTGQPLFAQGADLGGGAVIGRPTIKNDAVYAVTSTGRVAKVAAAGTTGAGTVLWSVAALPGGPADDAAPAVQEDANGTTYVFVGDAAGRIHKLNAQTGAEVLSAALPNNQPLTTTPAVGLMAPPLFDLWAGAAKSILRINADDLTVRAPSPITTQGNVLSPILVYPILTATGADRIVVAGDDSGHVNLLSATTGAPIGAGSYAASGPVIGATVVSVDSNGLANFVYVPCTDGSIHRIAIPSGTGSALVTGLTRPSDGAPISLDQAVIVVAKPGSTDEFVYAPGSVTSGGQTNGVISILNVANTATRFGVQVPGKPGAPAYSPNGNVVVVGSSIGAVVALPAQ